MKQIFLIVFMFATALTAQIQILPDINVTDESQIKIYLYKKALPYSGESLAADSLSAFFPRYLPTLPDPEVELPHFKSHYLNIEGDTRWALEGTYKFYFPQNLLSSFGARVSWLAPKGNIISRHYQLNTDLTPENDEHLGANILYFDSEKDGLDSKFIAASIASYHEKLSLFDVNLSELSSSVGVSSINQDNLAFESTTSQLMINHSHLIDLKRFELRNAINIYSEKVAIHSSFLTKSQTFEKVGVDLLFNGKSFVAAPSFIWRHVPDFDAELSLSNLPMSKTNDYAELLEKYRWLYFSQSLRNTLIPLNLRLRYENGFDNRAKDDHFGFRLQFTAQYRISDAHLTDSVNPDIPELYFTDVFANQSSAIARFGNSPLYFEQSVKLDLAYMTEKSWIRVPYQPLLTIGSEIKLDRYPYHCSLALDQKYFSRDHFQNSLPEVFDLQFAAAYDIDLFSQLYIKASNLLGADIWDFYSLPKQGTELYAGFIRRF